MARLLNKSQRSVNTSQKIGIFAFVALFVMAGVFVVLKSFGAGAPVAFEAESGNLAGAAVTSVTGQSGTGAVKFGSLAAGACLTGAKNAPGTADPWGGCWPGPQNTGVPAGTTLRRIPEDLTSGTGWSWQWWTPTNHANGGQLVIESCSPTTPIVFDSMLIGGSVWLQGGKYTGFHTPDHPCVKINKSRVMGVVYIDSAGDGPVVMTDSEVDAGFDKEMFPNVGYYNIYATRVSSYHGEGVLKCAGWCNFTDNWVHDMKVEPASHANAIGTNGLESPLGEKWVVEHNYASCGDWAAGDDSDSGGCSGDISLFPNFANIHDVYVHRNYLTAARPFTGAPTTTPISNPWHYWSQPAYCIYTGNDADTNPYRAQNVVIDDNVFGKGVSGVCGVYGPVANWAGAVRGNVFSNNKYDDGTAVPTN